MEEVYIAEEDLKAALQEHARLAPPPKKPCRELIQKYAHKIKGEVKRGFTIEELYLYLKERLGITISLRTFRRYLQTQDVKSGKGKEDAKKVKAAPAVENKRPVAGMEENVKAAAKMSTKETLPIDASEEKSSVPQPPALPPETEKETRSIGVAAYDPTQEL